jgi:hypothetical protein
MCLPSDVMVLKFDESFVNIEKIRTSSHEV